MRRTKTEPKLDERVCVCLTADQKRVLMERAQEQDVTIGHLMRRIVRSAIADPSSQSLAA